MALPTNGHEFGVELVMDIVEAPGICPWRLKESDMTEINLN